jgi:hypothetical protein
MDMSVSGIIFATIVTIKIVKSFFDGLSEKPDTIKVGDEIIKQKAEVKFISNGVELNESIRRHYYKVIDIHSSPIINNEVVFEKYQKHLNYLKEDQLLGYKVKYSTNDLKAAHYYLDDLCEYFGNLN